MLFSAKNLKVNICKNVAELPCLPCGLYVEKKQLIASSWRSPLTARLGSNGNQRSRNICISTTSESCCTKIAMTITTTPLPIKFVTMMLMMMLLVSPNLLPQIQMRSRVSCVLSTTLNNNTLLTSFINLPRHCQTLKGVIHH